MAQSIATARSGAKVIGIGNVDVRKYENLEAAAERCAKELGGIDYVMCVYTMVLRFCWGFCELIVLFFLVPVRLETFLPRSINCRSMPSSR